MCLRKIRPERTQPQDKCNIIKQKIQQNFKDFSVSTKVVKFRQNSLSIFAERLTYRQKGVRAVRLCTARKNLIKSEDSAFHFLGLHLSHAEQPSQPQQPPLRLIFLYIIAPTAATAAAQTTTITVISIAFISFSVRIF